jgi:hypothetical protein
MFSSIREHHRARQFNRRRFGTAQKLVEAHFSTWTCDFHMTRPGFELAIASLQDRPATIIETGTSAWGTDSSRLFDAYVRNFGGEFWTVDIRPEPGRRLESTVSPHTHLCVGDSVKFLEDVPHQMAADAVSLVYLDSRDLDWSSPQDAAEHGLAEWRSLIEWAKPGTHVLVDDTPASLEWIPRLDWQHMAESFREQAGWLPGKGALIDREVASDPRVAKVFHGYNVLYQLS